ncbi:MAG: efflux RND transporter periplasmic adaptor subunit [Lachnospiraceae bacterium]|nr:efflux RND transporter periplasmic adaptor subunit [Lachnospiraceae bacterium]
MEEKQKKWKPKKKTLIIAAAVLLLVILGARACADSGGSTWQEVTVENRDITSYLEFSGNVEAVNTAKVYAEATAKISEVLVEEGDAVKAGDMIAILDSGDIEYNIQLKELALEQTKKSNRYNVKDSQNSLDNLNEQIDQGLNTSLNSAEKALLAAQNAYLDAAEAYNEAKEAYEEGNLSQTASAQQTLNSNQAIYEAAKEQYEKGTISAELLQTFEDSMNQSLDALEAAQKADEKSVDTAYDAMLDAKENFENAQRDYESAQLSVQQNVESYENALERTQALSGAETSELELTHLKDSLADYTICAPIDGYVTRLDMKKGDYTSNAMAVAEVTNFDTMQIAIKIDEYDSASVSEGDAVSIYMDAQGLTYEGKIARISRVATVQNGISYLEAIVEFEADDKVYSGFSAEVKLIKAAETGVPALAVEQISYDTDNSAYVMIKNSEGEAVKQPVTLGVSDGTWVQIKEGLEAGDVICVTPSFTIEDMMKMRDQMMGM